MPVNLSETTRPVSDYREALSRIEYIQSRDSDVIAHTARTRFLGHGQKTSRMIILLHSLTSSPGQFEMLGHLFQQQGYNVYIPRMPHHGHANRLTETQANLTVDKLFNYLNESIDLSQGLGQHVTVAGLGIGGTLAALAAQMRGDVDQAILINAVFAVKGILGGLSGLAANLPNQFLWWQPFQGANYGPDYMYPRFSSHAAVRMFEVAKTITRTADQMPLSARRVLALMNNSDPLVDHSATEKLIKSWQARSAHMVLAYRFSDWPSVHEAPDPNIAGARAETVCQTIVDLVNS